MTFRGLTILAIGILTGISLATGMIWCQGTAAIVAVPFCILLTAISLTLWLAGMRAKTKE